MSMPQHRPLDEEERVSMVNGLKAKWEKINTDYQGGTHITKLDTKGKMRRRECDPPPRRLTKLIRLCGPQHIYKLVRLCGPQHKV